MSGRSLKRPVELDTFLPDFLHERSPAPLKSLDEQRAEFALFKAKYQMIKASVHRPS